MLNMVLNNLLDRIWYKNHPAYILLLPLSLIFGVVLSIRKLLYSSGIFKTKVASVPVIVVGNFTTGGTGKTPFVIWLVEFLKTKGLNPGVISRGYGVNSRSKVQQVCADSEPGSVGDEPVLIARRTGVPVAVSADKYQGAMLLIENEQCDVLICDDGLQHLSLGRDLEIAIIDGDRKFGNKYLLPAGPLREPLSRMSSVDIIISKGTALDNAWQMNYEYGDPVSLLDDKNTMQIESLKDRQIHVVSGIANPGRLHEYLKNMGIRFECHIFPDHFDFSSHDLNFADNLPIVMTEKDAVKCIKFANPNMWYLPIQAVFNDVFIHTIDALAREKIYGQKIT